MRGQGGGGFSTCCCGFDPHNGLLPPALPVCPACHPMQVSQTSFSRFGTRTRGDTSGWTDTPEVAAKRAAGLLTDTPGAGLLTFAGAGAVPGEGAPVSATLKAAMEQYGQNRQKSLLEMHAERQAAGGGSSKGRGGGGSSSSKGGEKQKGEKGGKDKKSDKKSDKKDKKKDGKNKTQPAAGDPSSRLPLGCLYCCVQSASGIPLMTY